MPPTPNMNLILPTPTVTVGPGWATTLNTALTTVDSHDHSSGKGVPIPSAGISLNADLPLNSFNATLIRSLRLNNQGSPLALGTDIGCIYQSGGNLYWNNQSGQQVQITAGAALNAASIGAIGGDYATSTASEFYTSASSKFTFWAASNVAATIDVGPIITRPTAASANGITIAAPNGLAANYQWTLPGALPASVKILTCDASGNIGVAYDVDNSTLQVASNTLSVKNSGITVSKLATLPQVAQTSYTTPNSSVTANTQTPVIISALDMAITATGRPIYFTLGFTAGSATNTLAPAGGGPGWLFLYRGANMIVQAQPLAYQTYQASGGNNCTLTFVDPAPPAGAVTYHIYLALAALSFGVFGSPAFTLTSYGN